MLKRWMLSKFFRNGEGKLIPVCTAYTSGLRRLVPRLPENDDDWALVHVLCVVQQVEAASQDYRIVVCPAFDSAPAPEQLIAAYSSWGLTPGMTMGQALQKLGENEPIYLSGMHN